MQVRIDRILNLPSYLTFNYHNVILLGEGVSCMAVSYNRLWKLLIDRKMKKKDLAECSGVSLPTLSRMARDENVTTDVLEKICRALGCEIQDILEFTDTSNS